MEDRQILIDQLSASDMEVLVALWGLEQFYVTIPFHLIRSQLGVCGYPSDSTSRILIQHGVPMLIKSGTCVSDFTQARGNGAVAGCQKSNTIARAVNLIGLGDLRAYTRETLGCTNSLLPKYIDVIENEEADISERETPDGDPYAHGSGGFLSMADAQANARIFNSRIIRRTPGRSSTSPNASGLPASHDDAPVASPFGYDTTYLHRPATLTPAPTPTPRRWKRMAAAMRKAELANKGCLSNNKCR